MSVLRDLRGHELTKTPGKPAHELGVDVTLLRLWGLENQDRTHARPRQLDAILEVDRNAALEGEKVVLGSWTLSPSWTSLGQCIQ